jgi:hypothetical protein
MTFLFYFLLGSLGLDGSIPVEIGLLTSLKDLSFGTWTGSESFNGFHRVSENHFAFSFCK